MSIIQAIKSWRVIMLLAFLVFAIVAIHPAPFNEGVSIRSVMVNSSASLAGIANPKQTITPLSHEIITGINEFKIRSVSDYYAATSNLVPDETLRIVTNKATYTLTVKTLFNETVLKETEPKIVEELDPLTNISANKTIYVPKIKREVIGVEDIGLRVAEAPTSNLRKGLDLAGGTRVLLQPEGEVSQTDLNSIIDSLTQRLNVYGLSDVIVRDATDLSGTKFISVEMAGVTEDEVKNLLARQGKFEAKISNSTVFIGGQRDIAYVCRTAECSGIDPQRGCGKVDASSWSCSFFFAVTLSPDAAQRHADATANLEVVSEGSNRYLEAPLELYLDDKLVDTLKIAADLKGQASTNIAVSGGGSGRTEQEAASNTLNEMKRLQTLLITGSLPVKVSIVKMDTISPSLGEKFMNNLLLVAVAALVSVVLVVAIRYRSIRVAAPMVFTMVSEIILILGFAALVGWNLDIAAMAGIVIAIGTGVDNLIVIADETVHGEVASYDWKKKLKNAMFIIVGAYLTNLSGMLPLWFAGAGMLRGFAFTTIAGVSFGVLIARPAYAAILKVFVKA